MTAHTARGDWRGAALLLAVGLSTGLTLGLLMRWVFTHAL